MTAAELIELLENVDPNAEVRLATQPQWPFEYSVGRALATDDLDTEQAGPDEENVVWLAAGSQSRYLPGHVAEAAWQ